MKARELANLGVPKGPAMKLAVEVCMSAAKSAAGVDKAALRQTVVSLLADPAAYPADPSWRR